MRTALFLIVLCGSCLTPPTAEAPSRPAHAVFFELHSGSPEAVSDLEGACLELLSLPEVEELAVGRRAQEFDRELNEQEFHVGLHVVFQDTYAYESYLTSDLHVELVERFGPTFKRVVVYDYWLLRP